jgi:hypothetical protein
MRFKEVKKLISEEQDLFEVNMSPSHLAKLAGDIDARAGMEFEMYVPNVEGGGDDADMEPDYDQDQRCRSIDDAYEFFYDRDYNNVPVLRPHHLRGRGRGAAEAPRREGVSGSWRVRRQRPCCARWRAVSRLRPPPRGWG